MPSTSGGALRPPLFSSSVDASEHCFYALDVGRGVATVPYGAQPNTRTLPRFLCPRRRAGRCDMTPRRFARFAVSFYALDVGRGVATISCMAAGDRPAGRGFYALDVGRGVATG